MNTRYRAAVAACLAAAWVAGACSRRPDRVVLGIGLSPNSRAAIELAAREINQQGGIDGVPLELVGMDWPGIQSRYDPELVVRWADRFVGTEGLLGVIGHGDSATTLSAAATYNKRGLPHLVTIATAPAITSIGPWTYRICLSDAVQGPRLADYVVGDWKKRRIVLFYVNDDYGRGLAGRFETRVRELGGTMAAVVMHRNVLQADDREMIQSSLDRLTRETPAPDLFVLFQRTDAAAWTAQAIRASGLTGDVLGCDNLAQSAFVRDHAAIVEGMRLSQFFQLAPGDARADAFARHLVAATRVPPDYAEAFAYDALYLFRDAVKGGGFTRAGVKAYLDRLIADRTPVKGVAGTYTIGPDHDARRPFYVAEARGGQLRILAPLEVK